MPSGFPLRMTPSEALVETLVANGVTDVFGIVGSPTAIPRSSRIVYEQ